MSDVDYCLPTGQMTVLQLQGEHHTAGPYVGRKIVKAEILNEALHLTFAGGTGIKIWDGGQDCCESRYLTTDDIVTDLVGKTLWYIDLKQVQGGDEGGISCHEIVFVEIGTDDGHITLVNHNEHNGWYGGFRLMIAEMP